MEQQAHQTHDAKVETKAQWEQPRFRVIEARDAELGLGVGDNVDDLLLHAGNGFAGEDPAIDVRLHVLR